MFKLFRRNTTPPAGPVPAAASSGPARDAIEKACAAAEDQDPMAIVLRVLRDHTVRLAGPEQHFLVAGALVAAWSNVRGEQGARAERVADARRRSEPAGTPAGKGPSPAAVGAGTFVAIAAGAADPGHAHALAHRITARAAAVVGGDSGRCERRDAKLAILASTRFVQEHLALQLPTKGPSCEWSTQNRACVGAACPFNR